MDIISEGIKMKCNPLLSWFAQPERQCFADGKQKTRIGKAVGLQRKSRSEAFYHGTGLLLWIALAG